MKYSGMISDGKDEGYAIREPGHCVHCERRESYEGEFDNLESGEKECDVCLERIKTECYDNPQ